VQLKSVAHMPWRAMVYKSLNTFIDDLFAFVVKVRAEERYRIPKASLRTPAVSPCRCFF
jgi:hypothetical protein